MILFNHLAQEGLFYFKQSFSSIYVQVYMYNDHKKIIDLNWKYLPLHAVTTDKNTLCNTIIKPGWQLHNTLCDGLCVTSGSSLSDWREKLMSMPNNKSPWTSRTFNIVSVMLLMFFLNQKRLLQCQKSLKCNWWEIINLLDFTAL